MIIAHDFSALWRIAEHLGAELQPFQLNRTSTISAIEAELIRGREVKLHELEVVSGLLAYEGRQILLYIPDQGPNIDRVAAGDRDAGKKFHIAHCPVLDSMKNSGRFERYIATTDVSGTFKLTGTDLYNQKKEDTGALYVCQKCLQFLNYKQAKINRSAKKLRETFDLGEFFATFSSCFRYLPARTTAEAGQAIYAPDWKEISANIRASVHWRCEECTVDLSAHKHLLHTHHVDGMKGNNARANLRALCNACHRNEPLHDHMYVPREEMKLLNQLRRAAGIFDGNWTNVMKYADPALHGVLGMAQSAGWEPPIIEFAQQGTSVIAEAAWPRRRLAISLDYPLPEIYAWRLIDLAGAAREFG